MRRDRRRTPDRPQDRQPSRARHEDVGHGERRDPLLALVPAAERLDGRKARRLFRAHVGRRLVRNVQGRAARTAGARRIELPERRAAQYVRGPGLLGMGPLLAGIHTRQDALYSQHIHRLYGRSARLQNPAAEIADGGRQGCRRGMPVFRQGRRQGERDAGLGTGVFSGGRGAVSGPSRPDADRTDADGPYRGQGPAARRPLLRSDPRPGTRIHEGLRAASLPARHSAQDPAQRSGAQSVRVRSDVRGSEHRRRSQHAADDHHATRRTQAQTESAVPRKAVSGRQRIGQALQLVAVHEYGRQSAGPGQDSEE